MQGTQDWHVAGPGHFPQGAVSTAERRPPPELTSGCLMAEMPLLPSRGWCAEEMGCWCFENYSSSQAWGRPSSSLLFVFQR